MNLIQIALAAERFSQSQPPISVHPMQCIRTRDKSADCDRCVQACPAGAIRFEGDIQVNSDACIRCGLCLHLCPTSAFSGTGSVPRLVYCATQIVDHESLEIACAPHPDPAQGDPKVDAVVTTTGCLAALGISAYLSLAACGVKQIRVRLDACAACPLASLQPQIEATINEANTLLQAVGRKQTIAAANPLPKPKRRAVYSVKNPPVSRRGFLQAFKQAGRDFLPSLEVESERQRMVAAVRQLAPADPDQPVPGDSFASFSVSDACNACSLCARICPTGALEFACNDTQFELTFSPAACVNCGLCAQFCVPDALQQDGAPTVGELINTNPVVLHNGTLTRCRKCNVPFAGKPGTTLCPVCTFRQERPFGAVRNIGTATRMGTEEIPFSER